MSENPETASPAESRPDLRSDCSNCFGLCCVALPFAASADFAVDKDAGKPCGNLQADFRCGIHTQLRQKGFQGCTVYDCFGAGQQVSQITFGGEDWRRSPGGARQMFAVFPVVRQLHELLWYLTEALTLPAAGPVHADVRRALDETERLAGQSADAIMKVDVAAHRAAVNEVLLRTSELVRAEAVGRAGDGDGAGGGAKPGRNGRGAGKGGGRAAGRSGGGRAKDRRGADLIGARLNGADLHGANLRGAYLIAADLTGADLRSADLIGADFRDAKLAGADLTGSFFLTQAQLNAAKGDGATRLPASLTRPAHWAA